MTAPETGDYLSHHLKLASRADQLFSDAAKLIHQTSRRLPRAVNNLGLQALVATYVKRPGPCTMVTKRSRMLPENHPCPRGGRVTAQGLAKGCLWRGCDATQSGRHLAHQPNRR